MRSAAAAGKCRSSGRVAEAHPGEAIFPDERRWVRSPAETTAQTAGAAAHLRGLLDVAPHP